MNPDSLAPFFRPQGVAVIGASRDPTKLGFALARNLIQCGYPGAVHFVNPKSDRLFGKTVYASILDVPDPVDLAVLLAPPASVPAVLEDCGRRGIRAAIIASGGFREVGAEGAALEKRCLEIAGAYGMRLIGPNCIGIIDTHLPLDTTFLQPPLPSKGAVAFVSHSGAICAAVIDWLRGQGIGLSALVSLGNQADVNETDMLVKVGEDTNTRVVTLYLESISNGQDFMRAARKVALEKPVIALKVGRFESGKRAAASHTGALAGSEEAVEAAFRQSGVLRANTTEEMFHWARVLAWCPLPKGRRVAVLTNAGGPGVTAADALELAGMVMANLSPGSEAGLKAILPAAASLHNPVDMLASASPELYAHSLSILLEDTQVDSVMVIFPPPPSYSAGAVARAIIPIIQSSEKPVVIALMGERMIQEAVEHFRAAQVPEYRFPEDAASALAVLFRRAELLERPDEVVPELAGIDRECAMEIIQTAPAGFLESSRANRLVQAYGIASPQPELVTDARQARQTAQRIGFPLVVKVASADISHKSDVGGVVLNVETAEEAGKAFDLVIQRARVAQQQARIDGAHLQRMLGSGQDTIIGVVRDARFGPMVMFGSGGVEVEGLKDVAFALAPLSTAEAERLVERTWAGRRLQGFRNLAPADRNAVLDALQRLAQLALDFPRIAEIEINPLRVLGEGQGAFALDVRVRLDEGIA